MRKNDHIYRCIDDINKRLIWLLNFHYLLQKLFISVEYICLSCDATSILTFVVTWKINTVYQWNIIIGLFNHKIYYQVVDIASFKECGIYIVFGRLSLKERNEMCLLSVKRCLVWVSVRTTSLSFPGVFSFYHIDLKVAPVPYHEVLMIANKTHVLKIIHQCTYQQYQ